MKGPPKNFRDSQFFKGPQGVGKLLKGFRQEQRLIILIIAV